MKKHGIRLLSALVACLILLGGLGVNASAAVTAGGNLLKNPGFEDGLTNWTTKATLLTNKHTISNNARTGRSSLRIKSYLTLLEWDGFPPELYHSGLRRI